MSDVATLTCPKCQGSMRRYERSGVTVDQCTECRGIFLDRGELERLIDAEDQYYRGGGQPVAPAPSGYPPPDRSYGQSGSFLDAMFGRGHHGGYKRGHH